MRKSVLVDLGKLKDPYSGLGQVSLNFGRKLYELNEETLELNYLIPNGKEIFFDSTIHFEKLSLGRRFFPSLCKKYDLWHAIHQDSPYMPADKRSPYLLTIHDLNFLEEKKKPKADRQLQILQKRVYRAQAIIYISNFTKSIAHSHLRIPPVYEEVIYNGVDIDENAMEKPSFLKQEEFIFAMGMIKKKKNFEVLIDWMRLMPEENLVIAGNKSFEYSRMLENRIREEKLQARILLPGIVSEKEKNWLYKHCKAFVFPSKYEGFGLPVIEAMRFGKPVFLSRYSSLPEIGGGKAFYWDNFDSRQMLEVYQQGMERFKADKNLANEIQNHSRQFSWENNVKAYLRLYHLLLNG